MGLFLCLRKNERGFTLVEVLAAVSILAIVIAAFAPNLRPVYENYQAKTGARQIASDLRYAQQMAILNNREWKADFDLNRSTYRLYELNASKQPADPANPRKYIERQLEKGIIAEVALGTRNDLVYNPDGSVEANGHITVKSLGGDYRYKVVITPGTGRVRVERVQ